MRKQNTMIDSVLCFLLLCISIFSWSSKADELETPPTTKMLEKHVLLGRDYTYNLTEKENARLTLSNGDWSI